ncbi:outer membrane beta-barrel domain-containing protein [Alteromonas sp. ASW11-19]|uniref:Outer membrane beta-barrel domain-containing protein n=1 Tax=Alteromonas salexigens TaxID=2982530 RepID=A0ABT2VUF1_9ALTE|nr:outer membrane beta-barrel domain-containing protein [Alteromonas salexigens]MCU7556063.1 outer membrane beta-barrel domain-containing protein [Alteromonas salexigens]
MATRLFSIFLGCGALLGALSAAPALAQSNDTLASPDVVSDSDINHNNIEFGAFVGQVSIEDFSSGAVYGLTLSYHITENLYLEAQGGVAEAGETSFEVLSGGAPLLTEDERDYQYYDLAVGYNLNGEIFFTDGTTFNTDFYVQIGGGSTDFAGDNRFTLSLGTGYRVLLTDRIALRLDVRDRIFSTELTGEQKDTHNLQYTLAASVFF